MTQSTIPRVFVCIINWNKRDDTLACVQSVLAQDYPSLRIVVIDNGSTDGSVSALRALGGRIDLIEHKENLGFTGGCNAGMRHALAQGGDYIWLLNNDSECKPDTVSLLIDYAEGHPDVGMVSPIITDRNSGVDNFAIAYIDLTHGYIEYLIDTEQAEAIEYQYPKCLMLKGTALLLSRKVIERAGFFDDRFFMYCEDNDYSVRVSSTGLRAACVVSARVYHDEDGLPGHRWRGPHAYYYTTRNGMLFWRKHVAGLTGWKYGWWHACMMSRQVARGGYREAETGAFADGLWNGLRGVTGRWEPSYSSHHMPRLLRRMFMAMPALSIGIVEANPRAVLRALRHPFRSRGDVGNCI